MFFLLPMTSTTVDETPICRSWPNQRGNLAVKRARDASATDVEKVNPAHQRGILTHVAFASADAAVQKRLPQILVGNGHVLPLAVAREIRAAVSLPRRVYVWRRRSSWMDVELFSYILRLLMWSLRPVLANRSCPSGPSGTNERAISCPKGLLNCEGLSPKRSARWFPVVSVH